MNMTAKDISQELRLKKMKQVDNYFIQEMELNGLKRKFYCIKTKVLLYTKAGNCC